MPLLTEAVRLYDAAYDEEFPGMEFPGLWEEQRNADIEVTIDADGSFVCARELEKYVTVVDEETGKKKKVPGNAGTVTPVTLFSEVQTSGSAPRPLLEKGKYLISTDGPHSPGYDPKFRRDHDDLLCGWNDYAGGDERLEALITYLRLGTIVSDLLRAGIIPAPAGAFVFDMTKDSWPPAETAAYCKGCDWLRGKSVRFAFDMDGDRSAGGLSGSWDAYTKVLHAGAEHVFDVITGASAVAIHKHPRKILPDNGNGKLISESNKESSMLHTIGRRFFDLDQGVPDVSWESSIKAHRMIRWLVDRSIRVVSKRGTTYWMCFSRMDPSLSAQAELRRETGLAYGIRDAVGDLMTGNEPSEIKGGLLVAALDHSTKGRVSIVRYTPMDTGEFYDRLRCWRDRYSAPLREGRTYHPTLSTIVVCAFGVYKGYSGDTVVIKDAVRQKYLNCLMGCLVDGLPVPANIVNAAADRVAANMSKSNIIKTRVLLTAAALLYGQNEGRIMHITDKEQSRSYLYGRLLAVLDQIESKAYYKMHHKEEQMTEHTTNAQKFWSLYVTNPDKYSVVLEEKVMRGYIRRLSPKSAHYYRNLVGEIREMIGQSATNKKTRKLDNDYILGYHEQRNALVRLNKQNPPGDNAGAGGKG